MNQLIFAKTNSSLLQWKSRHNLRATISPDRAKKREFIIDLFALPPENRRAPPPQNYICAISNYVSGGAWGLREACIWPYSSFTRRPASIKYCTVTVTLIVCRCEYKNI